MGGPVPCVGAVVASLRFSQQLPVRVLAVPRASLPIAQSSLPSLPPVHASRRLADIAGCQAHCILAPPFSRTEAQGRARALPSWARCTMFVSRLQSICSSATPGDWFWSCTCHPSFSLSVPCQPMFFADPAGAIVIGRDSTCSHLPQPGSQAARQPGSQAARQPGSQAARQPGSWLTDQAKRPCREGGTGLDSKGAWLPTAAEGAGGSQLVSQVGKYLSSRKGVPNPVWCPAPGNHFFICAS